MYVYKYERKHILKPILRIKLYTFEYITYIHTCSYTITLVSSEMFKREGRSHLIDEIRCLRTLIDRIRDDRV